MIGTGLSKSEIRFLRNPWPKRTGSATIARFAVNGWANISLKPHCKLVGPDPSRTKYYHKVCSNMMHEKKSKTKGGSSFHRPRRRASVLVVAF